MKIPLFLLAALERRALALMSGRPWDFAIGGMDDPYLLRWYVIPRNPLFNIYLHMVLRSDDDRALHDHPWWNCSLILQGHYEEQTIAAGGIHRRTQRQAGAVCLRRAGAAHRLEVAEGGHAVTLFITGPVIRHWGFHCSEAGWRHWEDFTAAADKGLIGRGCGEMDGAAVKRPVWKLFGRGQARLG